MYDFIYLASRFNGVANLLKDKIIQRIFCNTTNYNNTLHMIKVLIIMSLGIGFGLLLKEKKKLIAGFNKSTLWIIFILLFFMGVSVGNNAEIMQNLDTIGIQGLLLSLASILGSIVLALIVYVAFFKNVKNER
jgi:uncharacterized membrane protein YbjE (DUF340 family)